MTERVILVDANDQPKGTEEKLAAHRKGLLHRAFSVVVFNDAGEMLLQRRAEDKYHSAGLWSNTCCSHPRPDEDTAEAAVRRLEEEMGFTCAVEPAFPLLYRADVGRGLVEYEYDHVFVGTWSGDPDPDPDEVQEWRWVATNALRTELEEDPGRFTYWFRMAFQELAARELLP